MAGRDLNAGSLAQLGIPVQPCTEQEWDQVLGGQGRAPGRRGRCDITRNTYLASARFLTQSS